MHDLIAGARDNPRMTRKPLSPLPPMPVPGEAGPTYLVARVLHRAAEKGLSWRALSLAVGKSQDYIRSLVRDPRIPKLDELQALSAVLERPVGWLLSGGDTSALEEHRDALREDVPVMGLAAGALDGTVALETNPIDYVPRPHALANARDLYAIYVTGSSMEPEHKPGELRYVHPWRPYRQGDTVILQTQDFPSAPIKVYIKSLVRIDDHWAEFQQWNPPAKMKVKRSSILKIHKVLTTNEIMGA